MKREICYKGNKVYVSYPMVSSDKSTAWYHLLENPPMITKPGIHNPWRNHHSYSNIKWGWYSYKDNFLNDDEAICYDVIT